jgi:hypothetical protein
VKRLLPLLLVAVSPALAQSAKLDLGAPAGMMTAAPAQAPAGRGGPVAPAQPAPGTPAAGPMTLMLRGLDKITGRPTDITAPIGKPVTFATLTITARYCYSTPPSEPPETSAFVQIEDHRPDQPARQVFSGWMYASSPGLNGMEHPLYDVWVIACRGGASVPTAIASSGPAKVAAPDSSDKEKAVALPAGAGQ